MLRQLVRIIEKDNLFFRNQKLLVAVSGGLDSVVLLHLLFKMEANCVVAHCNFNLRGSDSDGDQSFVAKLASAYNFESTTISFDTTAYAQKESISIEMAARDLRYNWFENQRAKFNCDYILTAHHADDVLETVLINLARGTGIHGITGIKAKRGKIVRPLLEFSRNEIKEYSLQNNIVYREDYTNAETDFVRNKIRHKIIPVLEEINPSIRKTMTANVARFRDVESIYNHEIADKKPLIFSGYSDIYKINIAELKKLEAVNSHLFELLSPFGFHQRDIINIAESLYSISGKMFYSDTHQLLRDRDFMVLTPKKENLKCKYSLSTDGLVIENIFDIQVDIYGKDASFEFSRDSKLACFDADKLKFPLLIRKWEEGDVFQPIGMRGRKKISDFFIDNKFSITDKANTWILLSDNNIVWIMGHRMDDRFKISQNTSSICSIKLI